ncbi:MAG TPA: hypothetical protein GXZ27_03870 [Thermoanaerobacterales bacterium]|nr:hypothetical protein [Thermoanaerobacterales bacterium]
MEAGKPIKQTKRGHRRSMVYPKSHAGAISKRYGTVTWSNPVESYFKREVFAKYETIGK